MTPDIEAIIDRLPHSVRAGVLTAWRATPPDDRWHIVREATHGRADEVGYLLGRLHQSYRRSTRQMHEAATADAPAIVLEVRRSIRRPFRADVGELIVVWPDHPSHTLTLCSRGPFVARRWTHLPSAALSQQLLRWYLDGCVRVLNASDEAALWALM